MKATEVPEPMAPPAERHWSRVLGRFTAIQAAIQLLGAVAGIVIVRLLDKEQYALFTIAASLQAAAMLLMDCGINAGLLSMGGRSWRDPAALGRVVNASLRMRLRLSVLSALLVTPVALWMLLRSGASPALAVAITAILITGLQLGGALPIHAAVLKLHSRFARMQAIEAGAVAGRLAALVAIAAFALNALGAIAITVAAQVLQNRATRKVARTLHDPASQPTPAEQDPIAGLVRSNLAFSLYAAVQGQIAILVIGVVGSASEIADLGALTRLGFVAALGTTVLNTLLSASLARAQRREEVLNAFGLALAGVTIAGGLLIAACALFPDPILWVFGAQYAHLRFELLLTAVGVVLNLYLAVLWATNTARAWLFATWLLVPLTVAVQLACAAMLDLGSVAGVLWFSLLSQVPNLVWGFFMLQRGLARLNPPAGA